MNKIKVMAFVGPSGTGKSYRAQMVAGENNIDYIIDDGILVNGNKIVAGESAKKAPTKIETVKNALFIEENRKNEMINAIKKFKPEAILILGTSDGMVEKIVANLGLPKIEKIVYIQDYASPEEMEEAKRMRVTEGKHVIPVPTFELKKDFSGYILDPLQIFKFKGKGNKPYVSEKSIIRPTFSYLGNFTISDTVFRQILEYIAKKEKSIARLNKARISTTSEGAKIYMEVTIIYGYNIQETLNRFKTKAIKEIQKLTAMKVESIEIIAKDMQVTE